MNAPVADHDGFGHVVAQPLSRIAQIGGRRLLAAWTTIPSVTHHEDADVTGIERERIERFRATGEKASLLGYLARACILALNAFPKFNATLDPNGETLWLKQYLNLGFAIDTSHGLLVAVVAGAGHKSVATLAHCVSDLAVRARSRTLKPSELEGAGFTISSLGNLGGTSFTPIINPPNVAILGASQARIRPEWIADKVVPRLVLPLSLTYDHRIIDGADAARFCSLLRELLGDPIRLNQ